MGTQLAIKHFAPMPEAAIASAFACVYHSIGGTLLANIFAMYDLHQKKKAQREQH
jgi:BASS family bile acid:Na+ symporter